MAMKIVIGQKDGKSLQQELTEDQVTLLIGKKIGDIIKGDDLSFEGYEFQVTGGSDRSGTPMRKDVEGSGKTKILAVEGVGINKKRDGQRQRKTVAGNTIDERVAQVNLKVTKAGKKPLIEEAPTEDSAEGEKSDEKKEDKKE